jgi:hypothetical protein
VHGKTKPALSKDWAGELHDWVKKKGPAAWLPSPYSWSCLNMIHLVKIHNKCMHYANVTNECQILYLRSSTSCLSLKKYKIILSCNLQVMHCFFPDSWPKSRHAIGNMKTKVYVWLTAYPTSGLEWKRKHNLFKNNSLPLDTCACITHFLNIK